MLGIKSGDLLEICRCVGCGTRHPCGEKTCKHDFAFAIEDERQDNTVLARFFLIGDVRIPTSKIIAYKWAGWIPEEIASLYEEWSDQNREDGWDWEGARRNPDKDDVLGGLRRALRNKVSKKRKKLISLIDRVKKAPKYVYRGDTKRERLETIPKQPFMVTISMESAAEYGDWIAKYRYKGGKTKRGFTPYPPPKSQFSLEAS